MPKFTLIEYPRKVNKNENNLFLLNEKFGENNLNEMIEGEAKEAMFTFTDSKMNSLVLKKRSFNGLIIEYDTVTNELSVVGLIDKAYTFANNEDDSLSFVAPNYCSSIKSYNKLNTDIINIENIKSNEDAFLNFYPGLFPFNCGKKTDQSIVPLKSHEEACNAFSFMRKHWILEKSVANFKPFRQLEHLNQVSFSDLKKIEHLQSVFEEETENVEKKKLYERLVKIFETRPICSKAYILKGLQTTKQNLNKELFAEVISKVAFYWVDGPFRKLYTRFNYNPHLNPESKVYQIIEHRNKNGEVENTPEMDFNSALIQVLDIVELYNEYSKDQTEFANNFCNCFRKVNDLISEMVSDTTKTSFTYKDGWFQDRAIRRLGDLFRSSLREFKSLNI